MAIKDNRTNTEEEIPLQVINPDELVPNFASQEEETIENESNPDPEETAEAVSEEEGSEEDTSTGEESEAGEGTEESTIPDTEAGGSEEEPDEGDEQIPSVNYQGVAKHFDEQGALSLDDAFETDTDPTDPGYFQEAIEYTVNKRVEAFKKSFQDPVSQRYLEYLENGGDPAKFIEVHAKRDYNSISNEEIENSSALQRMLVEEEMRATGDDEDTIKEMIEIYEERGVLEAQARRAQKRGAARQEAEQHNLVERQKQAQAQAAQAREEFVKELETDVNKRDSIGGFALTPKSKRQFIDFVTKTDKNGATKLQKAATDADKQLLMAYLYFIDFDFSTLSKEASTKATEKLRENLGNFTDPRGKGKAKAKPSPRKKSGGYDKDVLQSLAGL